MDESFGKEYKLCSKNIITALFEEGKQLKAYPFMLRYDVVELRTKASFQIAISVPKRRFKKAVDRNRIKRLIREAVRRKKYILEDANLLQNRKLALFLIYIASKEETYETILRQIESVFIRLAENKT